MSRSTSDHFPILLEVGGLLVRGPLPFRFGNMWLKDDGFKILINGKFLKSEALVVTFFKKN